MSSHRSTTQLAGLVLLLGAALLVAAPGASACLPWPTCSVSTPCPKDGHIYFYCMNGKAVNGCQISSSGAFPAADCSEQCLAPAHDTVPICSSATPCPKDGHSYYYCMSGKAVNGCQAVSRGLFPGADCTVQCQAPASPAV